MLLSLGGIVIAAFVKTSWDGGWGGAVAVAIAFGVLFVRRDYGKKAYDVRIRQLETDLHKLTIEERTNVIWERLDALDQRLAIEANGLKAQNKALAWASVIGTLAWGFGGKIATLLSATRLCH